jgi:hypothetical protein
VELLLPTVLVGFALTPVAFALWEHPRYTVGCAGALAVASGIWAVLCIAISVNEFRTGTGPSIEDQEDDMAWFLLWLASPGVAVAVAFGLLALRGRRRNRTLTPSSS